MTVWRITDGEDGLDSGARAAAPRYDIVEHDTALLRIAAASASPRLQMSGEIDVSNAPDVGHALHAAQARMPGDLHVDLTAVEFVDVAGPARLHQGRPRPRRARPAARPARGLAAHRPALRDDRLAHVPRPADPLPSAALTFIGSPRRFEFSVNVPVCTGER
ncbi:STAS domain-containing protein [Actinomadura madurae]|uniref:STAS domain-containing protein n=1 Tax=Actinomadura madurae TaxID=1993 RepID=UPI0020D212B6|nr:STAS domain-containing protein [Actinomadura madurae]MCQ0005402.1 STAS domain-containing protein [Actinomadura madurae]